MKSLNWSLTLMLGLSSSLTVAATLRTRACTFTWAAVEGETCESMSSDWGIPLSQFLTLNPSVGPNCENGLTPGVEYCVEGEVGPGTTSTVASVTATSTSASSTTSGPSVPSPTQPGLIETCTSFYQVVSGDTCEVIASKHNNAFSLTEFYAWNPAVGNACTGLWLGYFVCVGIPGTPTAAPTASPSATGGPSPPSPTQPGLISSCQRFHLVESGNTCDAITTQYGISLSDFYEWNPAVGSACSGLWLGYYVCIAVPGTSTRPPSVTPTATSGPSPPSPTQAGLIESCNKFHLVESGNTCEIVANQYGISLANFYRWNPAVGSACTGLWLGYYVCVGVPGMSPQPTPTTSTSAPPTGPTPTQAGIVTNCNRWYQAVSGDFCQKIVDTHNGAFTLGQFYSWNPAVGSDCSGLWLGYYYCVGVASRKRSSWISS
ncbi:LysM domain-containing protein-like protein 1 [Colletotrichum chrysophilum]|uniref:LysM domain-containing protein-like protein 1 n=1 Tax=Colletotrichum chrysophilum TaxID=1836956 RepID=A0AAD9EDN4_9PEZI|nr:LysM domain-containing protein-like protein 1 [Colletotrichum chrysophilum]